jgi:hypothetical protein
MWAPGTTSCIRFSDRRNVDLPQPDGQISSVTLFGSMAMSTLSTASVPPRERVVVDEVVAADDQQHGCGLTDDASDRQHDPGW